MILTGSILFQVKFTLDENTTFADLLSLKLHDYEDEVRNIVDKSKHEADMEKSLNNIKNAWVDMCFEHEKHARTGITMLKASEVLIETLEENQVRRHTIICQLLLDLEMWLFFYDVNQNEK